MESFYPDSLQNSPKRYYEAHLGLPKIMDLFIKSLNISKYLENSHPIRLNN